MGRVDPLRNITLETVRQRRGEPLRIIRENIKTAISEASLPRGSGRRHMRLSMTPEEVEFHEKVERRLRLTR